MTGLTIGKVAAQAGVGVETIRFYERRGLVKQPLRPSSGFRLYPPEAVQRIRFIRSAKELGFSLNEISEMLELAIDPGQNCDKVKTQAQAKIDDIRERIASLKQMQTALEGLVATCNQQRDAASCPILDSFAES